MTHAISLSAPLAAEWSTGQTLLLLAYVASVIAAGALTIWVVCRHNPGAAQGVGKAGGQLIMFAAVVWPLWVWFVLPKMWADSQARAGRAGRGRGRT
jgi:hypothetical protein